MKKQEIFQVSIHTDNRITRSIGVYLYYTRSIGRKTLIIKPNSNKKKMEIFLRSSQKKKSEMRKDRIRTCVHGS